MRSPHGHNPKDIIEIFGRACSCKLWTCRICVQERLLQKNSDPHPLSLASTPAFTLQFPPPLGCTLYTGTGEPVSDSSAARCPPKLYKLTCVPWQVKYIGGKLPDWLAQSNALAKFHDAHGFNTQQNYRLRSKGSYQEYMQPIHDTYAVAPLPCKAYGYARGYWTAEEAQAWNATGPPAYGSQDDCATGSGWEWGWQEDVETWTQAEVKLRGRWQVARDAFSPDAAQHREGVRLADDRIVATRCSFCTFLYGRPKYVPQPNVSGGNNAISVAHPGVPEDVAISSAKLLVQFRAFWRGGEVCLPPADLVRMAERFDTIAAGAADFLKEPSSQKVFSLLCKFDPHQGAPGSASTPEDTQALRQLRQALSMHYSHLQEHRRSMLKRFQGDAQKMNTPAGWSIHSKPYKRRPHLTQVSSLSDLNGEYTHDLLENIGFRAPVFALVGGSALSSERQLTTDSWLVVSRLVRAASYDCKCSVPWHQRGLWERQLWVEYELPAASGAWHARWEESKGCIVWYESVTVCSGIAAAVQLSAEAIHAPWDSSSKADGKQDAPASGSAVQKMTSKRQARSADKFDELLMWTASGEEDVSSDAADVEESLHDQSQGEGFEEQGDEDMEADAAEALHENSQSEESWDADDPEGYGDCHQTPPRKTCHEKPAEEGTTQLYHRKCSNSGASL